MSKEMKFGVALRELENIIDQLEQGVDDIDDIVSLFEQGTELIKYCNKKLTDVETKIEVISKKLNGKADEPEIKK